MKEQRLIVSFINDDQKDICLECEIANTYFKKMKGLMNRDELKENKGMMFPFLFSFHRFFWMKNVKIPLDMIFVNKEKKIIWISEADIEKGLSYKSYWSHGFCKYVIETKKGFCKKNKIRKGGKIKIK